MPADITRLLRATAEDYELLDVRSLDRAGHPVVWEALGAAGRRLFAKRHKNALMHQRETAAYRLLAPALGSGRAPALLAEDTRSLLIVTSALPGTPVISTDLTAAEEQEVYRQAGQLLATTHAQPTTGAPVGEYLPWAQERARALARARDARLSDEAVEVLADATRAEPPPTALAYCHGDFGPRNWIVRRAGDRLALGLIDFERSHVEAPARRDLMRVTLQLTPHRPDLRAAFTTGYGRELTPQEPPLDNGDTVESTSRAMKDIRAEKDMGLYEYEGGREECLRRISGLAERPKTAAQAARVSPRALLPTGSTFASEWASSDIAGQRQLLLKSKVRACICRNSLSSLCCPPLPATRPATSRRLGSARRGQRGAPSSRPA